MRVWDASVGGVAFLYVFALGRRLAGPVCGLVAVFVLFVYDPLLFEHGLRNNNMEAPLCARLLRRRVSLPRLGDVAGLASAPTRRMRRP